MNKLVEYKWINDEHASIGNKFTSRVVASLIDNRFEIVGYAIREYAFNIEERIEVQLPDKGTLLIVYNKVKTT